MRLFVAVWPPPHVVDLVASLKRPAQPGVRWTASDQWHVTLRFLGEVADVEIVKDALGRLAGVSGLRATPAGEGRGAATAAGVAGGVSGVRATPAGEAVEPARALTAIAGPLVQRLGSSVLCLPVAGLDGLAAEVTALTADVGRVPDMQTFRGHLTLARGRRGVDLSPLAGAALSTGWEVREVELVASRLHPDGAQYQVVGRYPLRTV